MKKQFFLAIAIALAGATSAPGQAGYTNFVRQIQVSSGIERDVPVGQVGQEVSPLTIDPGGAHFELWTVKNSPLTSYLLDHSYVDAYMPQATVRIYSEDPYDVIPRTRADRPFNVEITVAGLLPDDPTAPDAAKMVTAMRHVESYGESGDGTDVNRDLAILKAQTSLVNNQAYTFQFSLTQIPGADRAKVRGEERFTVMSLDYISGTYSAPASQLASKFIQIWPVADGSIVGLEDGQLVRFAMPEFEIHLNDLYPDSETWAQVYPGSALLGVEGKTVPGSAVVVKNSVPQDRVLRIEDWDKVIGDDGKYTLELLTRTPFGLERLDYVTFKVNRTLKVHGNVTTIE